MSNQLRVLIIGGGIGGLVAALALRHEGIEATVFERVNELREIGAALGIMPNAIRALQKIGQADLPHRHSLLEGPDTI